MPLPITTVQQSYIQQIHPNQLAGYLSCQQRISEPMQMALWYLGTCMHERYGLPSDFLIDSRHTTAPDFAHVDFPTVGCTGQQLGRMQKLAQRTSRLKTEHHNLHRHDIHHPHVLATAAIRNSGNVSDYMIGHHATLCRNLDRDP